MTTAIVEARDFSGHKALRGRTLRERFEEKFVRSDGCWYWIASKRSGYGQINVNKRPIKAQRIAWTLYVGPIPPGLHVLHECDNPACVNPNHLFLGTHADNMADKVMKGRHHNGRSPGERNGRAKLSEAQVLSIRASSSSTYALGRQYGLNPATIGKIKSKLLWRNV
jgi:hypothetical protein